MIYNSVSDYIPNLKRGDKITFEGFGILDGLQEPPCTVLSVTEDGLLIRPYKARTAISLLPVHKFNQKCEVTQ